jgi:hypothetical protein
MCLYFQQQCLDEDFWPWQYKKWRLDSWKSINCSKNDLLTVKKVLTVQKWHLNKVYAVKSWFVRIFNNVWIQTFHCDSSTNDVLTTKNGSTVQKMMSQLSKKPPQLKNDVSNVKNVSKVQKMTSWQVSTRFLLLSIDLFEFLTMSQSKLSISTFFKTLSRRDEKYWPRSQLVWTVEAPKLIILAQWWMRKTLACCKMHSEMGGFKLSWFVCFLIWCSLRHLDAHRDRG